MQKNLKSFYIIGLMSGTSLDGVDLVYVRFDYNNTYQFEILESDTVSYSHQWKSDLKAAFHFNKTELKALDLKYGDFLAEMILDFITKKNIKKIDLIASHGHTIHHKPEENYTLQIGNGQQIARKTKLKTICDFRTQDVTLGGQGAPLVPIGDKLLFSEYDYCLNLGGFANISFDKNQQRIAYDICPVNIVLNHYVNQLGFDYDDKGQIASTGNIHKALLDELNHLEFFSTEKPKSLGFEFVTKTIFPIIDTYKLSIKDILRTYVEHIAFQIATKISKKGTVLITGGGAFNTFLIDRIRYRLTNEIIIPDKIIIDFKEALIFAFLGLLREKNEVNCLKTVTGANKNHSSGFIYFP
jgi:anhydro-N-acetylmuramic acid kinase